MRELRFFYDTIPEKGSLITLPPDESQHAVKTLRLSPGQIITIMDGRGTLAKASITGINNNRRRRDVICTIEEVTKIPRPIPQIHLFIGAPKGKPMGHIIRMATELGVASITPVNCKFSVAKPGKDISTHWLNEAIAAIKQSGNPILPVMFAMEAFDSALASAPETGFYGAVPNENSPECHTIPEVSDIAVWIGPEGGFSEKELTALHEKGYIPKQLGNHVLKVETAVPALLGWIYGNC